LIITFKFWALLYLNHNNYQFRLRVFLQFWGTLFLITRPTQFKESDTFPSLLTYHLTSLSLSRIIIKSFLNHIRCWSRNMWDFYLFLLQNHTLIFTLLLRSNWWALDIVASSNWWISAFHNSAVNMLHLLRSSQLSQRNVCSELLIVWFLTNPSNITMLH